MALGPPRVCSDTIMSARVFPVDGQIASYTTAPCVTGAQKILSYRGSGVEIFHSFAAAFAVLRRFRPELNLANGRPPSRGITAMVCSFCELFSARRSCLVSSGDVASGPINGVCSSAIRRCWHHCVAKDSDWSWLVARSITRRCTNRWVIRRRKMVLHIRSLFQSGIR